MVCFHYKNKYIYIEREPMCIFFHDADRKSMFCAESSLLQGEGGGQNGACGCASPLRRCCKGGESCVWSMRMYVEVNACRVGSSISFNEGAHGKHDFTADGCFPLLKQKNAFELYAKIDANGVIAGW